MAASVVALIHKRHIFNVVDVGVVVAGYLSQERRAHYKIPKLVVNSLLWGNERKFCTSVRRGVLGILVPVVSSRARHAGGNQ
jgi:hypothetical protein